MAEQKTDPGQPASAQELRGDENSESEFEDGATAEFFTDSAQSPAILVGIPAYNESETIHDVVTAATPSADEVVVVDDGSSDQTREQARTAGAMLISHEENRGYGATLGTIFEYARQRDAEHLVIIDADGQHDVTDIPDLVRTQQETDVEIITGSRFTGGASCDMRMYRRFGLSVVNRLTNLGLRLGYSYQSVSDTQCGFRAYNREAIESMAETQDIGDGMGASLDILFQAAREGHEIVEVPTHIDYDVEDANTRNPVFHGLDLLSSLAVSVIKDRPVRMASIGLCTVLAVGLFALALGLFGPVMMYVTAMALTVVVLLFNVAQSSDPRHQSDGTER